MSQYNLRNPAVKRLMREAEELRTPTTEYHAQPLEDNLFEWHFTLSGPPNTEFEGGIYHGRITLPPDYPMKPPSIILLTPNGRFETNKKICLSISGYHPESWQPSWSIRTALLAIIGFLPTHGNGAIGSLDYTPEERKELALKSQNWSCSQCGFIKGHLAEKNFNTAIEKHTSDNDGKLPSTKKLTKTTELLKLPTEETKRIVVSTNPAPPESSDTSSDLPLNSSVPSDNLPNELRHRQPSLDFGNSNTISVQLEEAGSVSKTWSSKLILVIVILLGILILRRLFC